MKFQSVKIPFNSFSSMDAVMCFPEDEASRPADGWPGVVVIHELWGLNDDIRRITGELARAGYAAIAPDLYSGGLKAYCVARTFIESRGGKRPLGQIQKTREFLANRQEVNGNKIGAIGFCMGGGLCLLAGAQGGFKAVSTNYGIVPGKAERIAGSCPVVASYGAEDKSFIAHFERLADFLDELGVPNDMKMYEGAGHSFLNDVPAPRISKLLEPVLPFGYHKEAAEDAWHRILAFFQEHIVEGA